MNYLVDANVLSETMRQSPDPRVVAWLRSHEQALVIDPIILGEIRLGVLSLPHGRKRIALESWFETVVRAVKCLPWDRTIGERWARLVVEMNQKGKRLPALDSMIAATALTHNLVVVTRNVGDFQRAGVRVLNPFM
ncbi:MAG: type II toxin-antitoxin system VapC family toxin [Candidatus Hydrogenedentes bacterium]|nr:type II toxin-antitoxin system VapC family toxin [Candidatus Hydrogenedentota bacterium]